MHTKDQRIKLLKMENDPDPIPVGTLGTILAVTELPMWKETQLVVKWDNGRTLSVILPKDVVEIVS